MPATIALSSPTSTKTHGYSGQERPVPQDHQYVDHLSDDSSCLLCGASAPQTMIRYKGVRQLRQQINRAQHLVISIKNQAKNTVNKNTVETESWKAKCEKLEEEMRKLQQENDVRKAELETLKGEYIDLRLKHAKLSLLEADHREAQRILSLRDETVLAELQELRQRNRQLSLNLRERLVEVETLERRLLEEEDANRVWRYKYVGSL
ncbi:hypothetical protein AbraIFM66951_002009 [Aspergillus brasiliensis]|uniref:Uncharacterized protein n=1 Tax=Aspergillus brasiliensis TaxID=319629 RepID=A0A9W6DRF8_9EURO|nr:hypothetical protein AbraCBS73388_011771 [Aspergillus brasiliensis]GKZ49445.1 hypothetical protein AbraIFM66951_002009 [Aspergillus brasiliensis]